MKIEPSMAQYHRSARPMVWLSCSTIFMVACARIPPYAPPEARIRREAAYEHWVGPIAALPVECATNDPCPPHFLPAVEVASRMALEFQGHAMVDSGLLNAETRRRHSQVQATDQGNAQESSATVETRTGRDFKDLTPEEQRALLESIGVVTVLQATVDMGKQGPDPLRPFFGPITVAFTLRRLADDAILWRSSCAVHTGNTHTPDTALETATRCAIEAETLF